MNHFVPSIARARECRRAMDGALWSSVRELLESEHAGQADELDTAPTSMLDYAAYFDLALTPPALDAVPANAKADAVAWLRSRKPLGDDPEEIAGPARVTNFAGDRYTAQQLARMSRWWDIEPANRMSMTLADETELARGTRAIAIAMDLLREADAELHGEIDVIVRDIVLAKPDGTNLINYSGASSFALWGAITINAETQCDWTQMLRQVVHEAAHNLLFAIARDGPLITNDPATRRASPLRADPRPMDGIYHAAFVSAREAWAFESLLQHYEGSGRLTAEDVRILEDLLELSVLAFWDCIATLREEADLTPLGASVLDDCETWMKEAFAVEPC